MDIFKGVEGLSQTKLANPMERALSLAGLALGSSSPNPAVGAVIIKNGEVVGEGYTQLPGSHHAEIVALKQAGEASRGASLYVTLEPCCHYGRTPPCTDAIIEAGISHVHMASLDPNPLVCGKGKETLEKAGIKTVIGHLGFQSLELNEAYVKYITTGVPFVTAKYAMSLDGKIATRSGHSKWISCEESRRFVHGLRYSADAIMVGINTIMHDDPQLTVRISGDGGTIIKQPWRVIVDTHGRTPLSANIFKDPIRTLIITSHDVETRKVENFLEKGAEVIKVPSSGGFLDLPKVIAELGKREISNLLVEGGETLLGSFFDHELIDKVVVFVGPIIVGGKAARGPVGGVGVEDVGQAKHLKSVKITHFGEDVLVTGYLNPMEYNDLCSPVSLKK
ncbi:bifunctional diaminohydroxyphosphoribosylaminopyrimidine deaminase/5-amino-6-(5-phosphoribosylamino)uracil reductase RibD [Chloroflexota bacterium]